MTDETARGQDIGKRRAGDTGWAARIWAELPRGRTLPEASWRVRHRAVVALLIAHAVVLGIVVVAIHAPAFSAVVDVAVPAVGAYTASRRNLSRNVRSSIAAVSLMLTSTVVVHLMHGLIEAHFHFFAMIPIVALYEDWVPFGLAAAIVLLHHGVMGTIDPQSVYNHASATGHPWRYAFIHAAFFAAACIGSVINWRLHEKSREVEKDLAAQMRYRALHDSLTGLPNRAQLLQHAQTLLEDAAADRIAVLMVDLDRFKEINDALGHAAGDKLLAEIGPRLAGAVRSGDLFARLGGDEFAAVLGGANANVAIDVAQRLLNVLEEPVEVDGVRFNVDASVGIAVIHASECEDISTLFRQADIAMYTAKRERSGFALYHTDQDTLTREGLMLLAELRQAMARDEIVLHYQPRVMLPGGELDGVEALARWQHPTRGLLAPSEFIPMAESTGLIVPLTLHILDVAVDQMCAWQAAGHEFTVAVNLSPRCLADPDLPRQILSRIHDLDLPSDWLRLEITENTLAHNPERAQATLTALAASGIRISIDDFGTGYSSMAYLKRLPVDELKVDRSFVAGMLVHVDDEVIVRSVVDLGHNLGLTVVAEGVEDQATQDALTAIGCDVVQGFYTGRPMTVDFFNAWLAERSAATEAAELSPRAALPRPRQGVHRYAAVVG
ncbi:MAG: putative bifunctional diguanylate cyclase/phosphodiesterase [Actinomycetes bacterium]